MDTFVVLLIAAVVIAALLFLFRFRAARSTPRAAVADAPATGRADDGGFRPPASDFRVSGGDAHVEFSVPLPPGDVDPVLRDILLAEAVEVLRAKRGHLPLAGVTRVHAYAMRDQAPVAVGQLTLDGPGELPPPPPKEHPLFGRHHGVDVFEELSGPLPGVASRAPADELASLASELRLTGMQDAGLRAQGIDPGTATTADLVAGLLRLAGYTVEGGGAVFTATRQGVRHHVEVVDHTAGSHPALSEGSIDQFMVRFGSSGAARGLLFTPKFGQFVMYDKERRQPGVRFVTRERFQTFVNSVALS
ncbi:MAG: hypothetical protein M3349_04540 [Actinomycetota bacterium]|nr:hypothetical protein [Actinomycetota bacterium]